MIKGGIVKEGKIEPKKWCAGRSDANAVGEGKFYMRNRIPGEQNKNIMVKGFRKKSS